MSTRFAGPVLVGLLALPVARESLERVMVTHMLVQIPLLAVAGAMMAWSLPDRWTQRIDPWNRGGVSGILLAVIASSWWMIPRALDSALAQPTMELAKFVSLPLLVGAPVALSWTRLGGIGQAFVIANVLPMWAVVGWVYAAAPVRLCNFYLADQQVVAGTALLVVSVTLAILAGALAFRPTRVSRVIA